MADCFKTYRKDGGKVELKEYRDILKKFNLFTMDLVHAGHKVKLPSKMGAIEILGKKIKTRLKDGKIVNQAPDYPATMRLWAKCPECKEEKQMVFHLNEHTNGVRYKFFWSKERMIVANKIFYSAFFSRTNKRRLAKAVLEEEKEYYVKPEIKYNTKKS